MKKIFIIINLMSLCLILPAQSVTNIVVEKTKKDKIKIWYEITSAKFNQKFNVSLYVSDDHGKTFKGPLKEVKGDVGKGIKEGKRMIIWDVMKEMPFVEKTLVFDVRVETIENPIGKKFFVSYIGNQVTPIGIRLGNSHKLGWFIEARASLLAKEKTAYSYNDGFIVNFNKPDAYYSTTGNEGYIAYYAGGGFTFQLGWNAFFYTGAGYGVEKRVFKIDEYSYDGDSKTGSSWVAVEVENYSGVEFSAGLMLRFGNIIISGGGTVLKFKKAGFTAGIGISF